MPRRSGTARFARRLGARVRALRTEAGMTQERLAWDCELDKGYLSQVESGKRVPSVAVLQQIAERLGVELADVVSVELDKPRLRLLDAARRGDRKGLRQALRELSAQTAGKRAG